MKNPQLYEIGLLLILFWHFLNYSTFWFYIIFEKPVPTFLSEKKQSWPTRASILFTPHQKKQKTLKNTGANN